jgi:hypothetical protein
MAESAARAAVAEGVEFREVLARALVGLLADASAAWLAEEASGWLAGELAEELSAARGFAPRMVPRRDGAVVVPVASDALTPVDPAEPVSSANAIGIATIAEPIPNANASAPTRPT